MIRDGNVPAGAHPAVRRRADRRRRVAARHHREARRGDAGVAAANEVYLSMNCWRFDSSVLDACRRVPLSRARRARTARRGAARPARGRHAVPRRPHEGRRPRPVEPRRHRQRRRPGWPASRSDCDGADCRRRWTPPASAPRPPPRRRALFARARGALRAARTGCRWPSSCPAASRCSASTPTTPAAAACCARSSRGSASWRRAGAIGASPSSNADIGRRADFALDARPAARARALEQLPGHGARRVARNFPEAPDRRRHRVRQRPAAGLGHVAVRAPS